jgi:hypothetical protein
MISFLLALGCNQTEEVASYQKNVRPILEAKCSTCHYEGSLAPFPFDSWSDVEPLAPLIVEAVRSRKMPPWGQDPVCRDSQGSLWLDDSELQAFIDWETGGFLEGEAEDYVAPAEVQEEAGLSMADPDIVFKASEPLSIDTSVPDDYRCILIGDPLEEELLLTASLIVPDNLQAAHHAILYAIPPTKLDHLYELDAQDDKEGYVCFGDPGDEEAEHIAGWAPGGGVQILPEKTVKRVPAGSQLVLQMHYYTSTLASGEVHTDQTEVQVWTAPPDMEIESVVITFPIVKGLISIPAGESESLQVHHQYVPIDAEIIATAPHMHTKGTKLDVKLVREDGSEECITDVDNWDFNWQRSYKFDEADWIPFSTGDRIDIECTYDNGSGDETVSWGDGTDDEMCLNYLGLKMPYYPGEGICPGYEECSADCGTDFTCRLACLNTGGISCLTCGIGGLYSDCVTGDCALEGAPLSICMGECMDAEPLSFLNCLHESCGEQAQTFFECAQQTECPESYESCGFDAL